MNALLLLENTPVSAAVSREIIVKVAMQTIHGAADIVSQSMQAFIILKMTENNDRLGIRDVSVRYHKAVHITCLLRIVEILPGFLYDISYIITPGPISSIFITVKESRQKAMAIMWNDEPLS